MTEERKYDRGKKICKNEHSLGSPISIWVH